MRLMQSIKGMVIFWWLVHASVSVAVDPERQGEMDGKTLQSVCSDYLAASITQKLPKDSAKRYMRCAQYMQGIVEASIRTYDVYRVG